MNSNITESTASGEQIEAIVSRIEPCLVNVPRGQGIIALLSMVLVLMYPDISADKLQTGVRDVSRYICMLVDDTEDGSPMVMN